MSSPEEDLARACAGAEQAEKLSRRVCASLAERHLTEVLQEIVGDAILPEDALRRLGFPGDIAACFPNRNDPSLFTYRPALPGFRLRAEASDLPLRKLRLNVPTDMPSVALGLKLLRDVLTAVPAAEIALLVRPGSKPDQLQGLIRRWGHDPGRVLFATQHVSTLFAQDDALSGTTGNGEALLLPRLAEPIEDDTAQDTARQLGITVARSRLYWEGGNILCDGTRCLIGANTIASNCRALGLTEAQVVEAFAAELGYDVLVLGGVAEARRVQADSADRPAFQAEGGQADFHLDLDVALLGSLKAGGPPIAVVADCDTWRNHLDEVLSDETLFADHFLSPDEMRRIFTTNLEATMDRRAPYMESYKEALNEAGYRLVSLPDVRLSPTYDYLGRVNCRFNFANVIPYLDHDGLARVLGFRYGHRGLDAAAVAAYGNAGVAFKALNEESTVLAHETFLRHGGVHCLVSKMA